MEPVWREAEEFVAKQETEVNDWAVEIWRRLFSLLRKQRAAEDFPDVREAVNVRIPLNLRMVVVHEAIHEGICVQRETQQQKAAEQQASLLWGNPVRHGHWRTPFYLPELPRYSQDSDGSRLAASLDAFSIKGIDKSQGIV
jgi:hypothetical protein